MTIYRPRFNRKSLRFDGVNEMVRTYEDEHITAISECGTISIWGELQGDTTDTDYLAARLGCFVLGVDGDIDNCIFRCTVYPNDGDPFSIASSKTGLDFSKNRWYNFIMSYERNGELKIYVDGIYWASNSFGDNVLKLQYNNPTAIGSTGYGTSTLNGRLNNFSIQSVQLTDGGVAEGEVATGEIAELYNNGFPINMNDHSAGNLELYWWVGEGDDDSIVYDHSGNNRDGTPVNISNSNYQSTSPGY